MSIGKYISWDLRGKNKYRRLISAVVAECLGVAVYMIVGCSAVAHNLDSDLIHSALGFGFGISIALMGIGHLSGGHVNPAVTVAALTLGKISPVVAIFYVLAQCIGGLIGMQTVLIMQPENQTTEFCVTKLSADVQPHQGVLLEAIFTSILALLACSAFDHRNFKKLDSLSIRFGAGVIGLIIAGAGLTGCSMNPARSLAPAVLFGNFENLWVYWAGPLAGGFFMSVFYRIVFYETPSSSYMEEESLENELLTNGNNIILQTRRNSIDAYIKADGFQLQKSDIEHSRLN